MGNYERRFIRINNISQEFLWADKTLLIIEIGMLKNKTIMEGWLKHLQICTTSTPHERTVIITRNKSLNKKETFQIAYQWLPLSKKIAETYLKILNKIASQGLNECWPVPPESGLALALAQKRNDQKRDEAFISKWLGTPMTIGEREKHEMKLCFGKNPRFF